MMWHISGHRLILVKSQPLTKHSPFQREMERIQIPIFIRVCRLMCRLTVFLLYKIIEFSEKKKKSQWRVNYGITGV